MVFILCILTIILLSVQIHTSILLKQISYIISKQN